VFPVVVVPYDRAWPEMFQAERSVLLSTLADLDLDIEHIGSTSVPGLAAKPKIDILVGLRAWKDLSSAIGRLSELGYEHEPQLDVPRHFSMKRGHPTTHRVHLVEADGDLWNDNLAFRDALEPVETSASATRGSSRNSRSSIVTTTRHTRRARHPSWRA
jgi:GrpB-like predicted nucleotidyltransferase (UPF0157 family)